MSNLDTQRPAQEVNSYHGEAVGKYSGELFIVGIGASAGGLRACQELVEGLSRAANMAFILVQHLPPDHRSMLSELLQSHTSLVVHEAEDGLSVEAGHLYVMPPIGFLSVADGTLHLKPRASGREAHLPFDFLLRSLALAYREKAACVVLSGTEGDGSRGLRQVKESGGLVIVQDPDEAEYDGMPRSAIATTLVDHVAPLSGMPEILLEWQQGKPYVSSPDTQARSDKDRDWLPRIIETLRLKTAHDFTLYKVGTLQRRIARRAMMAGLPEGDTAGYLARLEGDQAEAESLVSDLLINVTGFFRDGSVFNYLSSDVIPALLRSQELDLPLRLWIAGCSTGEETYSLAMLILEQVEVLGIETKVQFFATDVDAEALAHAREGLYSAQAVADLSPARLSRFFTREDDNFRVRPNLRALIIFAVQDLLADPFFSRLDLISCRNMLIYLTPEAQARVVSVFHFALNRGGILILGPSESINETEGRFEVVSAAARIFRSVGQERSNRLVLLRSPRDDARSRVSATMVLSKAAIAPYDQLCRQLVIDAYVPATVLISDQHELLHSIGPVDRYLHVPTGRPTQNVLSLVPVKIRRKLSASIIQAVAGEAPVVIVGVPVVRSSSEFYNIEVRRVRPKGIDLLLISFVDQPALSVERTMPIRLSDSAHVAELEDRLLKAEAELQEMLRSIEVSDEEHKAFQEEALSINEKFQATNEELLASEQESGSLNEELTALNGQLQETLHQQQTTSNDLQNILYSANVATIFLDAELRIRFFTPGVKALFNIIATDIGRPLEDLRSLVTEGDLIEDARAVLKGAQPVEQEVSSKTSVWCRKTLPYRVLEGAIEGVVITFTDIADRKRFGEALQEATRNAEAANATKSRFLAAASHDLRQPLQTLSLVQGLMEERVRGTEAEDLIALHNSALTAMSGILSTLLDIDQIESGNVRPLIRDVNIGELLQQLGNEFSYLARARGLELRTVPCSVTVSTDPRLLEQMIRNLLSNAIKYTQHGRVLLGCRRRQGELSVEVWDTGIGIAHNKLSSVFEEYRQLDNAARERSRGLGLGLSIVKRMGVILDHSVEVQSRKGSGSMFAILVPASRLLSLAATPSLGTDLPPADSVPRTGAILLVEDDPELRQVIERVLVKAGHRVTSAADGPTALSLVGRGKVRPDLLLADYNLPNGVDGLVLASRLRDRLSRLVPVIILSGDASGAGPLQRAVEGGTVLRKPVRIVDLLRSVKDLLPEASTGSPDPSPFPPAVKDESRATVYVVDDDPLVRDGLRATFLDSGRDVEDFASGEAFLAAFRPELEACLVLDAYLPGMTGLDLLRRLNEDGYRLPCIMLTGASDVPMVVEALKAGASNFMEKPVNRAEVLSNVDEALNLARDSKRAALRRDEAVGLLTGLTKREKEIVVLILAGQPNKIIAADLGLSQRTVETHRSKIMLKTKTESLPALARLAVLAGPTAMKL